MHICPNGRYPSTNSYNMLLRLALFALSPLPCHATNDHQRRRARARQYTHITTLNTMSGTAEVHEPPSHMLQGKKAGCETHFS